MIFLPQGEEASQELHRVSGGLELLPGEADPSSTCFSSTPGFPSYTGVAGFSLKERAIYIGKFSDNVLILHAFTMYSTSTQIYLDLLDLIQKNFGNCVIIEWRFMKVTPGQDIF